MKNKIKLFFKKNAKWITSLFVLFTCAITTLAIGLNKLTLREKVTLITISSECNKYPFEDELIKGLSDNIKGIEVNNSSSKKSDKSLQSIISSFSYAGDIFLIPSEFYEKITTARFTSKYCEELSESLGFELKYTKEGSGIIGLVVYDPEDSEYNKNFNKFYEWWSFEGENRSFSIFLNRRSVNTKNSNNSLKTLEYILQSAK